MAIEYDRFNIICDACGEKRIGLRTEELSEDGWRLITYRVHVVCEEDCPCAEDIHLCPACAGEVMRSLSARGFPYYGTMN